MEIEFLKADEIGRLKTVMEGDRFDPFRKYRMIPAAGRLDYRMARLSESQGGDPENNFILAVSEEDQFLAFASVARHVLASEIFGLKMGQVEVISVREGEPHLNELLAAVISDARGRGFEHLAMNIDASNGALLKAAQEKNFFLTSAQMMFMYYRPQQLPKAIDRFSVRKYKPADYEQVLAVALNSFCHSMRLSRDPYLDPERTPQFYLKWLNRLIQESKDRFGYVSSLGNEITGFLFGRFDPLFQEITGMRKLGEGLSGVHERGKGSYPALWSGALKGLKNDIDIFEAQCLIENTEVIKTLTAFDFQLVRSQYVMHCYLGEKE